MTNDPGQHGRRAYQMALAYGLSLVIGMAVFCGSGIWLDSTLASEPRWTLVGMGLGLIYGIYETWRLYKQVTKVDGADNE